MDEKTKTAVKIKITGIHKTFDGSSYGRPEETCEEYFGTLGKRGTGIYLIYETKETDGIVISNMLKFSPGSRELKRTSTLHKGTITSPASVLVYKKEEKCEGFYTTPYGRLDASVFTKELIFEESETNLVYHLSGIMEINNSPISEFELKIEAVSI